MANPANPRLQTLALLADCSYEATFEEGARVAFGPTAASFELESPAGRARQLTGCCVRAHAPWVREALAYRNQLADVPALHWHLLGEEQQRTFALLVAGYGLVHWPANYTGCPSGHVRVGADGSVSVVVLDFGTTLLLAPTRAHFFVRYHAPVLMAEQLGVAPPWAAQRGVHVPWAQLFAVARTPERWQHALALALGAAERADAATTGDTPLPACIGTESLSCWPTPSAALLAGLADAQPAARLAATAGSAHVESVANAATEHLAALGLGERSAFSPLALEEGSVVCTELPSASAAPSFERTPLSPSGSGPALLPLPAVAAITVDALFTLAVSAELCALVFADESLLRLEHTGQLWERTLMMLPSMTLAGGGSAER